MRKAVVAGQFYEEDADRLKKQIEECFLSKFGPGSFPKGKKDRFIRGAICPHAGYAFSGPAVAFVYKEIAESSKPDVFLILGTNHTGMGRTSVLVEDFETPLGIAKVDKEFAEKLVENAKIDTNSDVHKYEHSIEVQLPFLQFIFKDDFKFVPLVISTPMYIEKLAEGIIKTIKETGKKVCIIASSDFTHYGFSYSFVPFSENIKENLEKLDHGAIDKIKDMDAEGFMQYVNNTGATICGFMPIAVLIKTLEQGDVKLLKYYTSGDVIGDYGNSVSYAGLVIE